MGIPIEIDTPTIHPRIKSAVLRLCGQTGVRTPRYWATPKHCDCANCRSKPNMNIGVCALGPDVGFMASSDVLDILTPTELDAVICHELGHVHYRDINDPTRSKAENHEAEYRADRYTMQYGHAVGMRSALCRLAEIGGPKYVDNESETHPALSARIGRLERFIRSRSLEGLREAA